MQKTLKHLEHTLSQGEKKYLLNVMILKEIFLLFFFFSNLALASGVQIKETVCGKDSH